jgi:response regulator RpfG family c-di-GMP phosphodiesterase
MTEDQAMQTLKEGAGTQWDPFLIDIFIAVLNSIRANQPTPPTNLHS